MPHKRVVESEDFTFIETGPRVELPRYGDAETELDMRDEPDIDDYIDMAIKEQRLTSESQLAAMLGVTRATVSNWRQKKAWPSRGVMLRLAYYAGVSQDEALMHLFIWQEKQPHVRKLLVHMLGGIYGLKNTFAAMIFMIVTAMFGVGISPHGTSPANARTVPAQADIQSGKTVYYGKLRRRWRRFRKRS
ncbi:MAG TPA: helix-turn-helix transcriptional regulator [Ferrovibrio sp.]|uniref:helix-turn-helix domain-containing protein n=1 Tax=Ferrovibrio sp. TaxID=1917215 RepID=UPI002ED2B6F9